MKNNVIKMNNEKWKPVEGFEGLYQVSDKGRVWSCIRGKELKAVDNGKGYQKVTLWKDHVPSQRYIHRLVATAFIPNPDLLPQVNHINEFAKDDNSVENLEWCTCEYNNNYGTKNQRTAEKLSKKIDQYDQEGNFIQSWVSICECARQTGYDKAFIGKVCNGKVKTAYGYVWRYAKEVAELREAA